MDSSADQEARRAARVRNFLNRGDLFFAIGAWPQYMQRIALSRHRNNYERFRYFYFLVANGLNPEVAAEWTLMEDFFQGAVVQGMYDNSAHTQLKNLVQRCLDRTLFEYDYFDMTVGRVQKLKN